MPANWLRRVWYLLRREQVASDLDEEMRLHRELRAERLRSNGMEARDAGLEARRQFGNVTHMTEESRAMWGFARIDQLSQDFRFAARRLRQRPAVDSSASLDQLDEFARPVLSKQPGQPRVTRLAHQAQLQSRPALIPGRLIPGGVTGLRPVHEAATSSRRSGPSGMP